VVAQLAGISVVVVIVQLAGIAAVVVEAVCRDISIGKDVDITLSLNDNIRLHRKTGHMAINYFSSHNRLFLSTVIDQNNCIL